MREKGLDPETDRTRCLPVSLEREIELVAHLVTHGPVVSRMSRAPSAAAVAAKRL